MVFHTMLFLLVYILPFVLCTSVTDFDPAWTNWPLWSQVADKCSSAGDFVVDYFVGFLQLLSYLNCIISTKLQACSNLLIKVWFCNCSHFAICYSKFSRINDRFKLISIVSIKRFHRIPLLEISTFPYAVK